MNVTVALALDLILLLGLTTRLTLLVTADDLGDWFIRTPALNWVSRRMSYEQASGPEENWGWRYKLISALWCPWCIGFWIGVVCLAVSPLAWDAPTAAQTAWRLVALSFTINLIVAPLTTFLSSPKE